MELGLSIKLSVPCTPWFSSPKNVLVGLNTCVFHPHINLSAHVYKLDSELNRACQAITGCLKLTNVEELYLLSGIVSPSIRLDVCARVEKDKQETNKAHSLHGKIPAERRLKSRNCFLHSVKPANFPPTVIRCSEWLRRTNKTPHRTSVNLEEDLARDMAAHGQR